MSHTTSYTSRTGEVPCGDKDLYAFLTDVRNLKGILPEDMISGWDASVNKCTFRVEKAGRVTVRLVEALPYSMVSYAAENLFTGNLGVHVVMEYVTSSRSKFHITADVNMNPLVRMLVGDAAPQYLDRLIDIIEHYDGFDRIRGYNQSL
jgi:hypothetical protein